MPREPIPDRHSPAHRQAMDVARPEFARQRRWRRILLGRSSVNTIEMVSGFEVGDVRLSNDMSQYDTHDRIRLN